MATPHNAAEKGDFASIVLMPGDPLRAKHIADNYLQDAKLVTSVRGCLGYTGTYNGKKVSVMASGMGMPSIGIYSYELYTQYDVKAIIRIGSAGAYTADLNVGDVLLADAAWSESTYAKVQSGETRDKLFPTPELNELIEKTAEGMGENLVKATIHSGDVFYRVGQAGYHEGLVRDHDVKAVEMESFALFHNANVTGNKAACLLTISDSFVKPEEMSAEERQTTLDKMIRIALESAANFEA